MAKYLFFESSFLGFSLLIWHLYYHIWVQAYFYSQYNFYKYVFSLIFNFSSKKEHKRRKISIFPFCWCSIKRPNVEPHWGVLLPICIPISVVVSCFEWILSASNCCELFQVVFINYSGCITHIESGCYMSSMVSSCCPEVFTIVYCCSCYY